MLAGVQIRIIKMMILNISLLRNTLALVALFVISLTSVMAAEVLGEDKFVIADDGTAYWEVGVTCDDFERTQLLISQAVEGGQNWCAKADQTVCEKTKAATAKKVCSPDLVKRLSGDKAPQAAAKKPEPKVVNKPKAVEKPAEKKVQQTAATPAPKKQVEKKVIRDPYAQDRKKLAERRAQLNAKKQALKNREEELARRKASVSN